MSVNCQNSYLHALFWKFNFLHRHAFLYSTSSVRRGVGWALSYIFLLLCLFCFAFAFREWHPRSSKAAMSMPQVPSAEKVEAASNIHRWTPCLAPPECYCCPHFPLPFWSTYWWVFIHSMLCHFPWDALCSLDKCSLLNKLPLCNNKYFFLVQKNRVYMRIHAASFSQLHSTVQSSGPTIPEKNFHVSFLPKDVPSMPHSVSIPSENSVNWVFIPSHSSCSSSETPMQCVIRRHFIESFSNQESRCCPSHCEIAQSICSLSKVGLTHCCNYSNTICEYIYFHLRWQSTNHSCIFQMRHSPILLHHPFGLFNHYEDYRTLSVRKTELQHWPYTDEMHPKAAIQRFLNTSLPRSFLCRGPPATKNLCVHYFGFVLAPATSVLKTALLAPVDQLIILCAWAGYNQTLHQFIHLYFFFFVSTSYSLMLVVQLLLMKWISLFLSIYAQLVQCIWFFFYWYNPCTQSNS